MSYLNDLLKQGAARHRKAAEALEAARSDSVRRSARRDAVDLLAEKSSTDETSAPAFLTVKSDDYLVARLNARADYDQPAHRTDGLQEYREDTLAPAPGPYGMGGYAHLGRPSADHRGDAAEADAAYRKSVDNLNASRADAVVTAAHRAKLEAENAPSGEPDRSLVKTAEHVQAKAARKALKALEPDLEAAEREAEAALAKANENLNVNHPSKK